MELCPIKIETLLLSEVISLSCKKNNNLLCKYTNDDYILIVEEIIFTYLFIFVVILNKYFKNKILTFFNTFFSFKISAILFSLGDSFMNGQCNLLIRAHHVLMRS